MNPTDFSQRTTTAKRADLRRDCAVLVGNAKAPGVREGRLGTHGLAGNKQATAYLQEMGVGDTRAGGIYLEGSTGDGWLRWRDRHVLSGRAPALTQLLADCPAPLSRE